MRLLLTSVLFLPLVAAADEPLAKPPTDKYGRLVLPLTIRGQATNDKGEPVAGAKVFVYSMNHRSTSGVPRVLAETTSDAQGRYEFASLSIPVLDINQRNLPAPIAGRFQVYGLAAGYGHRWHVAQTLNQVQRPKEDAPPHNFYAGEACVADLRFEPAATLSGTITGDNGLPLVGVRVQVGLIDDDRRPDGSGIWSVRYLGPSGSEPPVQPDEFGAIAHLPPESRSAVTDAQGKYSIGGLRRETQYLARIGYLPEFDAISFSVATTERKLPDSVRSVGYSGTLDQKLILPRTVAIFVTAGASEQPLEGVTVRVGGRKYRQAGNLAKTDAEGRAILRLTPGKYRVHLDPPAGAAYLQTQADLTVAELPFEQAAPFAIQAGATLDVQAVEAGTGKPVAGVSFDQESDSGTAAQPLHSQSVYVDYPTTDAAGKLRAIVPPGPRRLLVAGSPKAWTPVAKAGEIVVFRPGETQTVRFEFKPAAIETKAPMVEPVDERLAKIQEAIEQQRGIQWAGTFRAKYAVTQFPDVKTEDIRAIFAEMPRDVVPDLPPKLNKRFPNLNFRYGDLKFVTDGRRGRSERTYGRDGWPASIDVVGTNGRDTVQLSAANAQASIEQGPGYHVHNVADLCQWPALYRNRAGQPKPELTIERKDGLLHADWRLPTFRYLETIDEATGFLYHSVLETERSSRECWQFAPRKLANGGIIAGLSAQFTYAVQRATTTARIAVLEDADLTPPPAGSFAVAAPSGTNVVDFRGDQARPKTAVTAEPVPDVIARANAIADDQRSILPVIKEGQPAPALNPVAWLTAAGKCDAPDLKGKVVLVDFWGTNCGFCIIELPEVQAVHKRLAAKGLVIVGMHDSGGEVEAVAQLAKKHGLTYLLGIDRPTASGRGFGAAFEAYGIRGIPNCAVIDQAGKVAFVGDFLSAAQDAEELLAVKSP